MRKGKIENEKGQDRKSERTRQKMRKDKVEHEKGQDRK